MNKILLFFFCCAFTFLISCKENKKNTPQLNEDQFINMLIDIHIIDGTKTETNSSLAITSNELVKVGDTVTVSGKIVLDKDFGYGYVYNVLLEEGKFK